MNLSKIVRQALEQRGMQAKDASKELGISVQLLRLIINQGHVPKDKTLGIIAKKLGLHAPALIMAAHREKVPEEVKGLFLAPLPNHSPRRKRVWPLSEEQCDYLAYIMSPGEIQLVRKFRQVSIEEQAQIAGYLDYMFALKREIRPRLLLTGNRKNINS